MEIPDWVMLLPPINASLNGMAGMLLLLGYFQIKHQKPRAHKCLMLAAFLTSVLFLGCYLVYHFALRHYTGHSSKTFPGTGVIRTVYFGILISHVLLAFSVPVLASITIYRGLRSDWERHKRVARITFPVWLYVSITGVIIYFMVYHWPATS